MGKISCSVIDERLCVEFQDGIKSVFIKGQTEGDVFHVRIEDFELFPGLTESEKRDISNALINSNVVID